MLALLLAVLTAASNAASNVLQRQADASIPDERSFSLGMVGDLVRSPAWLAGIGAVIVSFLLQAAALHLGTLAAVQPVVILELPLTLLGAALWLHAPTGRREWVAAALLSAGVAAVVGGLSPTGGSPRVGALTWVVGLGVSLSAVAVLVWAGLRSSGGRRGAVLGAATGVLFGLTAALMDAATAALGGGITGLLSSWATWAMVACGLAAMYLMQNALQAGRLVSAQPGITLLDPITSILWGTLAFGEEARSGAWVALAVAGAAAMVAGAVLLSRSAALDEGDGASAREPAHVPEVASSSSRG